MPFYVIDRIKNLLGNELNGKKLCIVGISYKANVSDLRQSPSLVLWKELEKQGAKVDFHDEIVDSFEGIKSSNLGENAFDLAIVAVRHSSLDINLLKKSAKIIFDCTGSIDGSYSF
jgi:UDP-N-acetyl-D-glucosamine dehydrogenase